MLFGTVLTKAQQERQEADKKEARRKRVEDRSEEEVARVYLKLKALLALPHRRDLITNLCWILTEDETKVRFHTGLGFDSLHRYLIRDLVLYINCRGLRRWDGDATKQPYYAKEVLERDYLAVIRRWEITEAQLDSLIADIQA